jgi:DNA-binding response OmpR family regulator
VPASLSFSAAAASQGNVLLIEGYDALAVAIVSTLKKFAPHHSVGVARSLAEARALAAGNSPELFIIDFDPPYPGLTEFLHEMQAVHAKARALVIAPGVSHDVAIAPRLSGLQFIGKPFEVADFGSAVQASLGPRRGPQLASSIETLRALNVSDIVELHCAGGTTLALQVKDNAGHSGIIHISAGQISHAETNGHSGVDALAEMFKWSQPRMKEIEKPISALRTIRGPWTVALLEAWRQTGLEKRAEIIRQKETRKAGKKIVVIEDTEMLLIFVEDVLARADPNFQITAVFDGTSGIKEIERVMPDLVVLDYSLPDLNGDEVCHQLLQNERTASIPVLMMSGHVAEMTAAAARLENVVATIAKPFLSDALVDVVQRTLAAEPQRQRMASRPATGAPVEPVQKASSAEVIRSLHAHPTVAPEPRERIAESIPSTVSTPSSEQSESLTNASKVQPTPLPFVSSRQSVVLGLFLEVVSMQFTPQLRMGAVRAKPSSFAVSLYMPSGALPNTLPLKTGFQLGRTELDAGGRIATLRLIPTLKPFQPAPTRNAFEIGDVALIPAEAHESVEFISAAATTMRMQLLAELDLLGVKLSPSFQVAQLILKWRSNAVRVTFSSNGIADDRSGAVFETVAIQLDRSARIAELLLNPIK